LFDASGVGVGVGVVSVGLGGVGVGVGVGGRIFCCWQALRKTNPHKILMKRKRWRRIMIIEHS